MKEENKADDAVDWILLSSVLKSERAAMTESVGEALGIHGDQLLSEVEAMVREMIDAKMGHLVSMITTQIALVMNECAKQKVDVEMKMAALRKDLGRDDNRVVHLPNPLGKRDRKTREQQSIQ